MSKSTVNFQKALIVLDRLLEGKTVKQAAFDAEIRSDLVTVVKHMFPLFLGLPRSYHKKEED